MDSTNGFLSSLNNRFRSLFGAPSVLEAEAKDHLDASLELVPANPGKVEVGTAKKFLGNFFTPVSGPAPVDPKDIDLSGDINIELLEKALTVQTSKGPATHPLFDLISYQLIYRDIPSIKELEKFADSLDEALKANAKKPEAPFASHTLYPELKSLVEMIRKARRAHKDVRELVLDPDINYQYSNLCRMAAGLVAVDKSAMLRSAMDWMGILGEKIEALMAKARRNSAQGIINALDAEATAAYHGRKSQAQEMGDAIAAALGTRNQASRMTN